MLRDLYSNVGPVQLLKPATYTSDQNSASVDLQNFNSCVLGAMVGASGDTLSGSVYILLELEESDDNSTWSDCADASLSAAVSGLNTGTFAKIDDAAEDEAMYFVGYKGNKRYVRVVLNVVGTHTNGTPAGLFAIKGDAEKLPIQ